MVGVLWAARWEAPEVLETTTFVVPLVLGVELIEELAFDVEHDDVVSDCDMRGVFQMRSEPLVTGETMGHAPLEGVLEFRSARARRALDGPGYWHESLVIRLLGCCPATPSQSPRQTVPR